MNVGNPEKVGSGQEWQGRLGSQVPAGWKQLPTGPGAAGKAKCCRAPGAIASKRGRSPGGRRQGAERARSQGIAARTESSLIFLIAESWGFGNISKRERSGSRVHKPRTIPGCQSMPFRKELMVITRQNQGSTVWKEAVLGLTKRVIKFSICVLLELWLK